ncbi:serine hydrolase [Psychrosphaera sp. F3M07]|uniref:serine hydrolase domain-containing protein n=1 Tax=Psychrosphaera sp. F3M07 TaxID=2841560 RepID=UPI001C094EDD|nr:serine hydrolase domain-containing protein [Psychrosphaera sp. F3M07]MBU2917070.1 serine hydrolase [Psychrosphaera sp. F3M07]
MKNIIQAAMVIFSTFTVGSVFASDHQDLSKIKNTATDIVEQYTKLGWFSGTVLIAKNGEVFHRQHVGMQSQKLDVKNTANTRYNIGSIMKAFTAVLVLQKVQSGHLKTTDTLDNFKLGFTDPDTANITIEHLLTHRSGLPDIFNARYRENPLVYETVTQKLQLLLDTNLLFKPGTQKKYSNYGYVVLGAILEKVSGQSFEMLLNENIFSRANLTNSSFKPKANHPMQSTRYTYLYNNSLKEVGVTEHPGPDGGIESSVDDIHQFVRALFYRDNLLKRSFPKNRSFFKMDEGSWRSYGGGSGVSAAVEVDLKTGYEIIVLANTDSLVAEFITQRILTFIKTGEYPDIKPKASNFAYQYYQSQHPKRSFVFFKQAYQNAGYTTFVGKTLNQLAMQLINVHRWKEAFDALNYLQFLYPKAPQVYDSLAFAHYKKGEYIEARLTFEKAKSLLPNFKSDYSANNYQKD